jgi:Major Facilitator Superfamily
VQAATAPRHVVARQLLRRRDFRRLLATRLSAQFGDGVFQAALAGTVLFNPQRAAEPLDVAAGFAVLLLPYSLVGPFAGVWLDRWSRRQVLVHANLLRAALVAVVAALIAGGVGGAPFLLGGLAVFSVNRFVLSALSAGLPHTTDERLLVTANALSTTSGALATVVGGGAALGVLRLVGTGDAGYAVVALAAAVPYVLASAVVAGLPRPSLGPDAAAGIHRLTAREVLAGMGAGARHVWSRPPAAAALAAIGVHRLCYGALTLMTLLLYRGTFTTSAGPLFPGGLTGLGEVLGAGAVGTLLGAAATPAAVRRIGRTRWVTLLLAGGGLAQLALGASFVAPAVVAAGFLLGFLAQAVKVCVDTTLQEEVDDDHRGRVFSVYDTLVNVAYVVALLLAALVLPASGVSLGVLAVVAGLYLAAAAGYSRVLRRRRPSAGDSLAAQHG